MYLSSEQTKVPGGYIVQSKRMDDDGDIWIESVVFTSIEGVIGYLQSYFSDWQRETQEDDDPDGDGGVVFVPDFT